MPSRLQGRQQIFVETTIGLGGHAPDGLFDAFELLLDGHVVGAGAVGDAGLHFLLQAADADHEELVEVGLEDGQELEAFQERHGRVLGLFEDAPVELQPAQLAVDVERRVRQVGRHERRRRIHDQTSPRG